MCSGLHNISNISHTNSYHISKTGILSCKELNKQEEKKSLILSQRLTN